MKHSTPPGHRPFRPLRRLKQLWRRVLAAWLGGAGLAHVPPPATALEMPPGRRAETSIPTTRVAPGSAQVVYKIRNGEPLEMFIFRPSESRFPGPRPCVVFFHGGGFRAGNPMTFRPLSEGLADVGVMGITVEYTLLSRGERIPRAAVEDARSAVRFVIGRAAEFGCDPQRIAVGGGSAGGYLALMTAFPSPFEDPADDLSINPKPKALLLVNPGMDVSDKYAPGATDEQKRPYSPLLMMDATMPPTLIFHGTKDQTVPFQKALDFEARAARVGAKEVTVVAFEGRGHGFFVKQNGRGPDNQVVLKRSVDLFTRMGWVQPGR